MMAKGFGSLLGAVILFAGLALKAQLVSSTRLTPGNVSIEKRFLFLIGSTRTNDTVRFSVTVAPNANRTSSPGEAHLMLSDGEGKITRKPLESMHGTNEPYRYQFEVSTNSVTYSQFVFRDIKPKGETAGTNSFWFFLKDFAGAPRSKKHTQR